MGNRCLPIWVTTLLLIIPYKAHCKYDFHKRAFQKDRSCRVNSVQFDSPAMRDCRSRNQFVKRSVINEVRTACKGKLGPEKANYEIYRGMLQGLNPSDLPGSSRIIGDVNRAKLEYAKASLAYCEVAYSCFQKYCEPDRALARFAKKQSQNWQKEIAEGEAFAASNTGYFTSATDKGAQMDQAKRLQGWMEEHGDGVCPEGGVSGAICSAFDVVRPWIPGKIFTKVEPFMVDGMVAPVGELLGEKPDHGFDDGVGEYNSVPRNLDSRGYADPTAGFNSGPQTVINDFFEKPPTRDIADVITSEHNSDILQSPSPLSGQ